MMGGGAEPPAPAVPSASCDRPPTNCFDNLTRLASGVLGAQVCVLTAMDFDTGLQVLRGTSGLPETWNTKHEAQLLRTLCEHVLHENAPLIVENAADHPLMQRSDAGGHGDVVAYLGVRVPGAGSQPAGVLSVIEDTPRTWTNRDVDNIQQLAKSAGDLIAQDASITASEDLRREHRRFTYAISHDLKAPANTLQVLLAELAQERQNLSEDGQELLSHCIARVQRMGQQVEDVLAYSRMVDRSHLTETVGLNAVLSSVLDGMKVEIEVAEAHIQVADLPSISADRKQMHAVFQHLLSNAVKFAHPDRELTIKIFAERAGHTDIIRVQDNGLGIKPEYSEKIFDLFARLHTYDAYPGSGIGLALCRRVARNHNGALTVTSEPGQGSIFSLHLPRGMP